MAEKPLGVGILGAGFGAAVQLPAFRNLPGITVAGIATRDAAANNALAGKHGLRPFASWQDLVVSPDVDLVSVAAPPPMHAEMVAAALRAGKSVLCEKPFTLNFLQASTLLSLAKERRAVHGIDFEFRELSAWQDFRTRVSRGDVGTVQRAEFGWVVGTWADPKRPWRWQCDAAQGGGVLGALGVHLLDAAEWVLGPMGRLHARTSVVIGERTDAAGAVRPVTAADTADIEMQTASGAPVSVRLSNVDPAGKGLWMEVHGDKGTLKLENTTREYGAGYRVLQSSGGKVPNVVFEDKNDSGIDARILPFQLLATRFVKAVREGAAFDPSFADGVRSQILLEAIARSSRGGAWEALA